MSTIYNNNRLNKIFLLTLAKMSWFNQCAIRIFNLSEKKLIVKTLKQ